MNLRIFYQNAGGSTSNQIWERGKNWVTNVEEGKDDQVNKSTHMNPQNLSRDLVSVNSYEPQNLRRDLVCAWDWAD